MTRYPQFYTRFQFWDVFGANVGRESTITSGNPTQCRGLGPCSTSFRILKGVGDARLSGGVDVVLGVTRGEVPFGPYALPFASTPEAISGGT